MYAPMIERCTALASSHGRLGFIVPVSSVSTDRYESLQKLLSKKSHLVYSSFDDRPSRLFDGLEHIRLTVHVFANAEQKDVEQFSTRYNKWHTVFRSNLFKSLAIQETSGSLVVGTMPKLCSNIERSLLKKLQREGSPLGLYIRRQSEHSIYYSRKVGYFLQVLDFEPLVLDGSGRRRPPSELKTLSFGSSGAASSALCALNSSLFYWFVTVFSDCRNLNKREIEAFPLNVEKIAASKLGNELARLSSDLIRDFKVHSVERKMRFSHDTLTVQCIFPRHSKSITDDIDTVLAKHYELTEDELDFITNYDIKYRLGADADEADEV